MSDPKSDATVTPGSRFSGTFLEYVRVLAWPLFALVVLVSFWTALHDLAQVLPGLLSQSESISFKGVIFRVKKSIADQASPEVRAALNELTSSDIRELLETSGPTSVLIDNPDDEAVPAWKHFIELGLATPLTSKELAVKSREDHKAWIFGAQTTSLYPKVHEIAVEFVIQAISGKTAVEEPSKTRSNQ